ncbi:BamA/TamA family outer membrane protein [Mangrovimonas sp. DI 80]|uniref:BamA/TamA family outer membrane protein n=1 Tax=Mangrovimonas sp. DI 80 TaxID=1779330 RepID=UPI000977AD63|nr:BamA/TamA family outer membrane protein [Mangrovimonas sp. DI 80]OMP32773.1 hypothetical protein BKM32_00215 [Mangrovimonas sp. DI 80]
MKNRFLLLVFLLSFTLNWAQQDTNSETKDSIVQKPHEFTVMPYISYNRNLEFMFGVTPMYMFRMNRNDLKSPRSMVGLAGVYTTNKSYFIAVFSQMYFKEDSWRLQVFGVTGDHLSQFYAGDIDEPGFYDYATNTTIINVGIKRKIVEHLYGGFAYTYSHYETDFYDLQPATTTTSQGLEINFMIDKRSNIYYPMNGYQTKLRLKMYPLWMGNDERANRILTSHNHYFPFRKDKDVLAARYSGQFGLGSIPFEQQVTVGGKDIRGYSEGKYRGDGLIAVQSEYRWNFHRKMGLVGFAGLATIYGSDTSSFDWKMYPGAGVGYRYQAFKSMKFNVGLDAAVGKDDWGIYFRIGEAF